MWRGQEGEDQERFGECPQCREPRWEVLEWTRRRGGWVWHSECEYCGTRDEGFLAA